MVQVQLLQVTCVDMTKNGGIRSVNFNESDLITCFANDYGYENWVKESQDFMLILRYGNTNFIEWKFSKYD